MIKNNKGGMELIAAVVIAVILAVVGAGVISLSYNHYKLVKEKSVDKERAYQFALGGIQKAVYEMQKDGDYFYDATTAPEAVGTPIVSAESWEGLNLTDVKITDNSRVTTNPDISQGAYEIEATVTY